MLTFPFAAIITNYRNVIYRTSATSIGTEAAKIVPERPLLHGSRLKFSAHLGAAGMYVNNSLNTSKTRDRYLDYCRDWEDKAI